MKGYPWEIGTRLANEVQAQDIEAAKKSVLNLVDIIEQESNKRSFDEVKLRMLQILTIANRAAYTAGANPDRLFNINIELVNKIIELKTKEQLLVLIEDTITNFIALIPERDFIEEEKINKAIGYIRQHCTTSVCRNKVADILGCCPSYLSRLFTDITGHTFKEFVLRHRMEKAKGLLHGSGSKIIEIAFQVGYNDPNYFSTAFKKVTGITPSQYRKKIASHPE